MPQIAHVRGEIARKEILVRGGEYGHATGAGACGDRTIAGAQRMALRAVGQNRLERAAGVIEGYARFHVAAYAAVEGDSHAQARVVEISCIWLLRRQDGYLLDQATAGEKDIADAPCEDAKTHSVEGDLEPIADSGGTGGLEIEFSLERARAFGMGRWKI